MQTTVDHPGLEDRFAGLDLVPAQAAVLDRDGFIRRVNAAWDRFARANGYRGPRFVGQNYLGVCDAACGAERDDGRVFATALRDVLTGRADEASLTYPCHSPERERWYKAVASRRGDDAVVCHLDITAEYKSAARTTDPVWNRATLHELKTPLNAIRGFSEVALRQLGEQRHDADIPDSLTTIRDSADQMLRVVNHVLRNADQAEKRDEDIPVNEILEEVCKRHRGAATAAGVSVETAVDGDLWLRADPDRVAKSVDNLVSNAIKYSHAGGRIAVEAACNRAGGTEIAVDDTGIGIAESDLTGIFNPHVRLDQNPDVAAREGTGLGLAVSRNLMHMLGGEIRVSSTPGAGSRFTLTFPAWRTLNR